MDITDANNDGIGLDGFDPVAQFRGEPLRGLTQYTFQVGRTTYRFADEKNLALFQENPAKFIPVGGGYLTGKMVGNANDANPTNDTYVGNSTIDYRRNLEDTPVNMDENTPTDIKEDGSVEMQNLSDSKK